MDEVPDREFYLQDEIDDERMARGGRNVNLDDDPHESDCPSWGGGNCDCGAADG
jgi:hypothetical protein